MSHLSYPLSHSGYPQEKNFSGKKLHIRVTLKKEKPHIQVTLVEKKCHSWVSLGSSLGDALQWGDVVPWKKNTTTSDTFRNKIIISSLQEKTLSHSGYPQKKRFTFKLPWGKRNFTIELPLEQNFTFGLPSHTTLPGSPYRTSLPITVYCKTQQPWPEPLQCSTVL